MCWDIIIRGIGINSVDRNQTFAHHIHRNMPQEIEWGFILLPWFVRMPNRLTQHPTSEGGRLVNLHH